MLSNGPVSDVEEDTEQRASQIKKQFSVNDKDEYASQKATLFKSTLTQENSKFTFNLQESVKLVLDSKKVSKKGFFLQRTKAILKQRVRGRRRFNDVKYGLFPSVMNKRSFVAKKKLFSITLSKVNFFCFKV